MDPFAPAKAGIAIPAPFIGRAWVKSPIPAMASWQLGEGSSLGATQITGDSIKQAKKANRHQIGKNKL